MLGERYQRPLRFSVALLMTLFSALGTMGCSKAYYRAMETIGREKRDILVDRVQRARRAQEAAKEEFSSALERFSALVGFEGGELEDLYHKLERSFENSQKRAQEVRERNDQTETVAEDLFEEWETELEQYSDAELRRQSERQLDATRARYTELMRAMRRAEKPMGPVLDALRDQVLYLKHNLNARAIGSLEGRVAALELDVKRLIEEMNVSIREARRFAEEMKAG